MQIALLLRRFHCQPRWQLRRALLAYRARFNSTSQALPENLPKTKAPLDQEPTPTRSPRGEVTGTPAARLFLEAFLSIEMHHKRQCTSCGACRQRRKQRKGLLIPLARPGITLIAPFRETLLNLTHKLMSPWLLECHVTGKKFSGAVVCAGHRDRKTL